MGKSRKARRLALTEQTSKNLSRQQQMLDWAEARWRQLNFIKLHTPKRVQSQKQSKQSKSHKRQSDQTTDSIAGKNEE